MMIQFRDRKQKFLITAFLIVLVKRKKKNGKVKQSILYSILYYIWHGSSQLFNFADKNDVVSDMFVELKHHDQNHASGLTACSVTVACRTYTGYICLNLSKSTLTASCRLHVHHHR